MPGGLVWFGGAVSIFSVIAVSASELESEPEGTELSDLTMKTVSPSKNVLNSVLDSIQSLLGIAEDKKVQIANPKIKL
jgi:hypothetical protein